MANAIESWIGDWKGCGWELVVDVALEEGRVEGN